MTFVFSSDAIHGTVFRDHDSFQYHSSSPRYRLQFVAIDCVPARGFRALSPRYCEKLEACLLFAGRTLTTCGRILFGHAH